MGDNTTTVEVPAGVNNFYVRTMLKAARPLLVHTRWAQTKNIPRNNSLVIKFRRYSLLSVSTTALTEGVTPTGKQLSVTNITGTVKQYGDFVTLSDLLVFSTLDPILTETADLLGQQMGNSIDQLTRDVVLAGTTVQFASTATSRGTVSAAMKFTKAEATEAVRTLQNNDAKPMTTMVNPSTGFNTQPINRAFIGIISPSTLFDLKDVVGFIRVEEYPNQSNVMEGEVGALDDIRFVLTTNAKVFSAAGSSGNDVHATLILAKDYYAISAINGEAAKNIIKPLGSAGAADPLDQRQTSGWKITHVTIRLNENFAVRVEHGISA